MTDSVRAANSGSREPDPSFTGSGPTGFDPGRIVEATNPFDPRTERDEFFAWSKGYCAGAHDVNAIWDRAFKFEEAAGGQQ